MSGEFALKIDTVKNQGVRGMKGGVPESLEHYLATPLGL